MLNFAQPRRDFRVSRSLFSSVQAPRVARCSARGQRDAGRALSSSSASSSNCGSAPKLAREAQLSHLDTLLRRLAAGSVALAVVAGSLAPPAEARAESPAVSTVHQAARCQPQPLLDVAGFLGLGDGLMNEKDPIEPFTLYGSTFKKYLIETLQGEKVVARKRGFTVDACVGVVPVSAETPEFQGLPTGEKVRGSDGLTCVRGEAQELKEACVVPCAKACNLAMDAYAADNERRTGYRIDPKDVARLVRSCERSCAYECSKPGKTFDFTVPFRR